ETHPLRLVDRDLYGVRGPRCASGGIRGISRGRRNRRHLAGGSSRWPGENRPGRSAADQLGVPCRRAAARLGSSPNSSGARRDRPDRPTVEGVSRRRGPGMTLTVDLHHTFIPDFYWEASNEGGNAAGGITPLRWNLDAAIAYLDEAGIDVAVPSISTPGA